MRLLFITIMLCLANLCQAQTDTTTAQPQLRLRISSINISNGSNVLESLGHSCIRVIDSNRTGDWHDVVFNYGMFDFNDERWLSKLIKGDLNYYLSIINYNTFITRFLAPGRSLEEQVLLLTPSETLALISALEKNALPENRYYQYGLFDDNCATRTYHIMRRSLGNGFVIGRVLPADRPVKYIDLYRIDIFGSYHTRRHWERIAAYIFLQDRMRRTVSDNEDAMFLPAYFFKGLQTASLNGRKLCGPVTTLRPNTISEPATPNIPFILFSTIAVLTLAGHTIRPLKALGIVMRYLVLISTGILGLAVSFAWLCTQHAGTENNLNLLWALPFNILVPFLKPSLKRMYAMVALALIALVLILHICGIMVIPMPDLAPLLLSLVIVFAFKCRPTT